MKRKTSGGNETGRVYRDGLEASIEVAEAGVGATMRIRGVANTFGVMRSGRVIHPRSLDGYFKRRPAGAEFGLLAQHGNPSGGFATVGKVTKLEATPRGLLFEAELASGTQLSDEARTLIAQKMLTGVSLGWRSTKDRRVIADEQTEREDPELYRILKDAGVRHAEVFYAIEPVELSLVDIPDDPNARIAARSGALADSPLESVRGVLSDEQFGKLRKDWRSSLEAMREKANFDIDEIARHLLYKDQTDYGDAMFEGDDDEAGDGGEQAGFGNSRLALAAYRAAFGRLADRIMGEVREVLETVLTDKALSYGEALLDDSIDDDELEDCAAGCKAHGPHRGGRAKRREADDAGDAHDRLRAAREALDGIGDDGNRKR